MLLFLRLKNVLLDRANAIRPDIQGGLYIQLAEQNTEFRPGKQDVPKTI